MSFDVRCLRDAEVVFPDGSDATAVVRRVIEFHRSEERIRGVARAAASMLIQNQQELAVQGDTRVELVVTPEALEVVRDHPRSARLFREMLEVENASYSVYEEVPISVGIVDGTVGINLTDDQGILKGGLVTEDDTVYRWAVDLFESCREEARPVDPEVIGA